MKKSKEHKKRKPKIVDKPVETVETIIQTPIDDGFEKTIQESKDAIYNEAQKNVKRGRGRPPKDASQASGSPSPKAGTVSQQPAPMPKLSVYLAPPLQALSQIPARKHGIPELAFDSAEAMLVADAFDNLLNVFIPDLNKMSPKTAAIFTFGITVSSVGFQKYSIYSQVMSERAKQTETIKSEKQDETKNDSTPKMEVEVLADSYFNKKA